MPTLELKPEESSIDGFSSQLISLRLYAVFFSLYYIVPERQKNWLILTASLIFYSVGAGSTVACPRHFHLGQPVSRSPHRACAGEAARGPAAIGVTINLLGLGYYKYGSFLWRLAATRCRRRA